jgi:hypothetical protein
MTSKSIMDTQVLHMNTPKIVTLRIPSARIQEFSTDIRQWRMRHLPFKKLGTEYSVGLYDNTKISMLMLKYSGT